MAILGIPIGISFILGVIAGPMIAGRFGTPSLFWLTAVLGLITVGLLAHYLPATVSPAAPRPSFLSVLRQPFVLRLDFCGFFMNAFMSSFWFTFPLIVTGQHHVPMKGYYAILIPMVLASGVTMFAFALGADRGFGRGLAAAAFVILAVSAVLLFHPAIGGLNPNRLTAVVIPGSLFLIGFTGLEPVMPGLVSKSAAPGTLGATQGSFQVLQYLGSFAGGSLAGALARYSSNWVMTALVAASFIGFLLMLGVRTPSLKRTPGGS